MKIKTISILATIPIALILALYTYRFGFFFWFEHSKWAEFGSFFGGVIGPVLAFFSLLYLAFQIELQWKEHKSARIDAEIKQLEDSISLNTLILISKLNKEDAQIKVPFSELILRMYRDKDKMYSEETSGLLRVGLSARSETLVLWANTASALSNLKKVNESRYAQQLIMVSVQIGYELCAGLDEAVKLATGLNFEWHFGNK